MAGSTGPSDQPGAGRPREGWTRSAAQAMSRSMPRSRHSRRRGQRPCHAHMVTAVGPVLSRLRAVASYPAPSRIDPASTRHEHSDRPGAWALIPL